MKLLKSIKQHLMTSILIAMIFGLIIGRLTDISWMKQLILPLTFLMVYPMMVTLNFKEMTRPANKQLQITTQFINFLVFPFIAFAIGFLFLREEPYLYLGLFMISLFPTSGMTISWTVLGKGNVHAAIKMVVVGLLLGGILSPFYLSYLLGHDVDIAFLDIFSQVLLVVFLPLILAFITQYIIIKNVGEETFHSRIKPIFPRFSTLGLVLIIFVATGLKSRVLFARPSLLLQIILPVILLYVTYYIIVFMIAKYFFNKADGIALMHGTYIRNLSIALAITLQTFEEASIAALLIAVAFIVQVQLAAFNVKHVTKFLR
ncbi:MAG: bile acid:sodium symporter [Candidatus Izemoplasma sp.]|nr:bile acid:sodium symporter [Candidatus Izemoplasma sp.]